MKLQWTGFPIRYKIELAFLFENSAHWNREASAKFDERKILITYKG
jgi:hypothetical protein